MIKKLFQNTREACLGTKKLLDQQFTSDHRILLPPSQGEQDQGHWVPQVKLSIYTATSNPQTQYFGLSLSGRIVTEDSQWDETSMAYGSNVCKLDLLPQYNLFNNILILFTTHNSKHSYILYFDKL